MTIAKANNIKKGEKIIDEINEVVKLWGDYALETEVRCNLLKNDTEQFTYPLSSFLAILGVPICICLPNKSVPLYFPKKNS